MLPACLCHLLSTQSRDVTFHIPRQRFTLLHTFSVAYTVLTEVWKATVDKRMVPKGIWLSLYAPKGVKSLCITWSHTVYVRKPDLVSCKRLVRLGGGLNTYFQRARLGGRLICEIGLYASIYSRSAPGSHFFQMQNDLLLVGIFGNLCRKIPNSAVDS